METAILMAFGVAMSWTPDEQRYEFLDNGDLAGVEAMAERHDTLVFFEDGTIGFIVEGDE